MTVIVFTVREIYSPKISEVLQVVESAAIILAASVGVYSVDAWRREHIGKRRLELAEEVLALFYKSRDIVSHIRSIGGYAHESDSRTSAPDESDDLKSALDAAYVHLERYRSHSDHFAQLQAVRYRFMAQLGVDATRPFDDLHSVLMEICSAANMRMRLARRDSFRGPQAEIDHFDRVERYEKICYQGFDDDPIQPKMDAILRSIEKLCRAAIEKPTSTT